jgi:hypothetical protein
MGILELADADYHVDRRRDGSGLGPGVVQRLAAASAARSTGEPPASRVRRGARRTGRRPRPPGCGGRAAAGS